MTRKIIIFLLLIAFTSLNLGVPVFAQAQGSSGKPVLSGFISSSGKIIPDVETNSVMVVDYPSNISSIEEYLKMADTPSQQVLIEAKIVEVQLNKENETGINWNVLSQAQFNHYGNSIAYNKKPQNLMSNVQPTPPTSVTQNPTSITTTASDGTQLINYINAPLMTSQATNLGGLFSLQPVINQITDPFSLGVFSNGISIDAILKLLSTQVKTNVLSAPQVTTTNNRRAKIDVVRTTPYVSMITVVPPTTINGATTSSQVSYTYASADEGVSMDVTPLINKDSSITLNLYPQVKEIVQMLTLPAANGGTVNQPQIDTRSMQTKVTVKSGQTLVIGGLIREIGSNNETKLPVLGDLPFLGKLFRSSDKTKQKTELLIFVSPKIVSAQVLSDMVNSANDISKSDESDATVKPVVLASRNLSDTQDQQDWSHVMARLDSLQAKMQDVTDNRESLQKEIDKAK